MLLGICEARLREQLRILRDLLCGTMLATLLFEQRHEQVDGKHLLSLGGLLKFLLKQLVFLNLLVKHLSSREHLKIKISFDSN